MAFIPSAMPGIVLGVSLIWIYLTLPIRTYGTIWVLRLAHMTKYIPYGIRAAAASMKQVNEELEETSLTLGATWFQAFRKIILPLLMPGFIAGWISNSIIALRELSISIWLYSYNSTVLSIMAFDLWAGGQYTYVCALGVLMVRLPVAKAFTARKPGTGVGIAE
jgi:iron(III) transport system permease protein